MYIIITIFEKETFLVMGNVYYSAIDSSYMTQKDVIQCIESTGDLCATSSRT